MDNHKLFSSLSTSTSNLNDSNSDLSESSVEAPTQQNQHHCSVSSLSSNNRVALGRNQCGSVPVQGQITPGPITLYQPSTSISSRNNVSQSAPARPHLALGNPGLTRHGTLLTANATPIRAAAELNSLLGNHSARLKTKAALVRVDSGSAAFNKHVTLEQAKSRARVEVDILPQTNVCVQGGHLRGRIKISVRKATPKEAPISISEGKIRVIGFESLGEKSRSIFYQCSAMLASITPSLDGLYTSEHDAEGFAQAKEGVHQFPFALYLSLSNDGGQAKGSLKNHSGLGIDYIAMVSLKIRDERGRRSIAHFYRYIEVWPRLDPTAILSPALRPLQATVSTNVSKDSSTGRIKLTASLHRLYWVAGQFCQVKIMVENYTNKTLKGLTLSLHRILTTFHSSGDSVDANIDSRQPEVSTKQVAESRLELGQSGTKGHASAKGWWLGVHPMQYMEFEHSILVPMDSLTVPRGRFFEIEYTIQVAIDSGSRLTSSIQVTLPIRIVGFLSIDPPPSQPISVLSLTPLSTRPQCIRQIHGNNQTLSPGIVLPDTLGCSGNVFVSSEALDQSPVKQNSKASTKEEAGIQYDNLQHEQDTDKYLDRDDEICNFELGNLSLVDDTDDVVHHAITTARDQKACGVFSDLYYAGERDNQDETNSDSREDDYEQHVDYLDSDSVVGVLETLMEEVALENEPNAGFVGMKPGRRGLGLRRHSSFASRVESKIRVTTDAFLNGDRDGSFHLERREGLSRIVKPGAQSGKPRLTLKVPPVLSGGDIQRSGSLSVAQSHAYVTRETSSKTRDGKSHVNPMPKKSAESTSAGSGNPSPKRYRTATFEVLPDTSTNPLPILQYDRERHEIEPRTMPPGNCCNMNIADDSTAQWNAFSKNPIRRDTATDVTHHNSAKMNTSLPHVRVLQASQGCVDAVKTRSTDAHQIMSPASATSTTSIGSISVKDKVKQLEERAKAADLM